jgi:hypothetical protein
MEEQVSRFLFALIRNFGVAIAISLFFAFARGPSHPPPQETLAAVAARDPESTAPAQMTCDRTPGSLGVVDAGRRTPAEGP